MRIGFAITGMHGRGGFENAAVRLTRALKDQGHDVSFLIDPTHLETRVALDALPHVLDPRIGERLRGPAAKILRPLLLARWVLRRQLDVVVTNSTWLPGDLRLARRIQQVTRRQRLTVVTWFHHRLPLDSVGRYHGSPVVRYADGHLAVSEGMLSQLQEAFGSAPVCLVPNAVDLPPAEDIPAVPPPPRRLVLVYAGRLVEDKRVDLILQAAARLGHGVRVWITGEGPDRERLVALAEGLGLQRWVSWCGWSATPWAPIDKVRASGDLPVLCLFSRHEAAPMVVVEALARGIPVVATQTVGALSLMATPELAAWLVPCDDPLPAAIALLDGLRTGRLQPPGVAETRRAIVRHAPSEVAHTFVEATLRLGRGVRNADA